jgi:pimeloyl-ACP methyl ester carboxylesterase
MRGNLLRVAAACALALGPAAARGQDEAPLKSIHVNGVDLHYVDRGAGEPVVFVHGGLMDYRELSPVADGLGDRYRTILYSRRYNHPNDNPLRKNHSALVDAEDLAGLIRALHLGPAHVMGVSYGAVTALVLGLRHPELVRSLVLAEPPLMAWLPGLPGGTPVFEDFMSRLWVPAGRAFKERDRNQALRLTFDYFMGPEASAAVPPEVRAQIAGNLREWEALTTSADAFPMVAKDDVRKLKRPVLLLTGERTYPVAKIIDPELERLLPDARRTVIPEGTHDMCAEQPPACAAAMRAFLGAR